MFDGIPAVALGPLGIFVLAIMLPYLQLARGKLRPEQALLDERENTKYWRDAHNLSEQARLTSANQVDELLEHARTTDAFIRSLPRPKDESV